MTQKMKPSLSPLAAFTSLWTVCLSCLRLVDCGLPHLSASVRYANREQLF